MSMRRILSAALAVLICLCAAAGALALDGDAQAIRIDEVHFPDETFRGYVKDAFDGDGDGMLSPAELSAATEISCVGYDIGDLTGIAYFPELTTLNCIRNDLKTLDVSGNPKLESLLCAWNGLTDLDVSQNTALRNLNCADNALTALDVSRNTALRTLDVSNNSLTTLRVTALPSLLTLLCAGNALTDLDVSRNTALTTLDCCGNRLASLDIGACPALADAVERGDVEELAGTVSYIGSDTYLSLDSDTELISVSAQGIAIDEEAFPDAAFRAYAADILDGDGDGLLSPAEIAGVKELSFEGFEVIADLTGIEVFTALESLRCGRNVLTTLDVSRNTALRELYCQDNRLTVLVLGENSVLSRLDCSMNSLAELDLRGCLILREALQGEKKTNLGLVEYGAERDGVFEAVLTCDDGVAVQGGGAVFIRGDVNGDGAVDPADAAALLRMLLSGQNPPAEADMNGSGTADLWDVILILRGAADITETASSSDAEQDASGSDA